MTAITGIFALATPYRAKLALCIFMEAAICSVVAEPVRAANLLSPADVQTPREPFFRFQIVPAPEAPTVPPVRNSKISKHGSDGRLVNAVAFNGAISIGDTRDLQSYVSSLPKWLPTVIYLDSPGGNLAEGLALGKFFHDANIETVIESRAHCASACALAFMGGRDIFGHPHRVKYSTGALGFHSFSIAFPEDKTYGASDLKKATTWAQHVVFLIAEYLKVVDADLAVLPAMLQASPDDINLISNDNAVALGIIVQDERQERLGAPKSLSNQFGSSIAQ